MFETIFNALKNGKFHLLVGIVGIILLWQGPLLLVKRFLAEQEATTELSIHQEKRVMQIEFLEKQVELLSKSLEDIEYSSQNIERMLDSARAKSAFVEVAQLTEQIRLLKSEKRVESIKLRAQISERGQNDVVLENLAGRVAFFEKNRVFDYSWRIVLIFLGGAAMVWAFRQSKLENSSTLAG